MVEPLWNFSQELVLFRTGAGVPRVFSASRTYLGFGGTARDRYRGCPFHAWECDESGQCAILYAD